MLIPPERKSFEITRFEEHPDGIYFYSRDFILKIAPKEQGIIRVSFTAENSFTTGQGEHLQDVNSTDYRISETNNSYIINLSDITLQIDRFSASIKAFDTNNNLIFSESEKDSKSLERFEVFKTKKTSAIKTEKIKTADGEKNRIIDSECVSDGFLYRTRLGLSFTDDEMLIGLGQFEDGVWNKRGTTQYLHQANRRIVSPLLISNKGYGIFLTTQSTAIFRDDASGSFISCEADEYLDYYLIINKDPEEIIRGMRLLSGKAKMLPKWAFGYLQSKERYETQQEILDTANTFVEKGIPVDALILDWLSWGDNMWGQKSFDTERFPNPKEMVSALNDKGIHFMMSIWPNMGDITPDYKTFCDAGELLPGTGIYDAFSENAREIYKKQLREQLLIHDVEAFWCDSSEPITPEWNSWFKRDPAQEYAEYVSQVSKSIPMKRLNSFGLYHAQTIYEEMQKLPGKRVCNLTRSGYPGSQKYGVILWSGDTDASWDTLKKQLTEGISISATGLPYWTFDIGAFFVKNGEPWYWRGDYPNGFEDEDYKKLYTRWFQLGAFLPIFRAHGTEIPREPWAIGEDTIYYAALKKAIETRYSLMPYIYTLAYRVWSDDEQMMKPLAFAYPDDKKCWEIADQYMLGPSLMVCPIVTAEDIREVYFPATCDWYDFFTREKYSGGTTVTISKAIDEIPVFVPENSLIPTCKGAPNTETLSSDIILNRYGEGAMSFDLYTDAGDGNGYENGEYSIIHLT